MSGDVTVTMKMTPKQAGALYVKTMRLEDEVKALKAERDALRAHVASLQYYIRKYQELGADFILSEALTKTPQQCLHDLKVEGYQRACMDFCAVDAGALSDLQPLIDQYSARVKAEDVLHERDLIRVGGE